MVATGTAPALTHDYISLVVFCSAFLFVLTFFAFFWLVYWLLIGVNSFIFLLRGGNRSRGNRS
jgi:hypothetical protein